MSIRLIPAPLNITFSEVSQNSELYEREFQQLSAADDDAIGQWIKLAKAKGDTQETDKVLLQLIVELHRKIDNLERLIKEEEAERLELSYQSDIQSIGFEHFELKEPLFETSKKYYGRIMMPVYPKRDVPLFFEAISTTQAQILKMHDRDITEWNAYVTARERIMIRQMKEKR